MSVGTPHTKNSTPPDRPDIRRPEPPEHDRPLEGSDERVSAPGGFESDDQADATIEVLGERIDELLVPYEAAVTLLVTIPGVSTRTAQVILGGC